MDPGCAAPDDNDECGDPLPTLAFLFNETDGRLLELNATNIGGGDGSGGSAGSHRRVVWDESEQGFVHEGTSPPRADPGTKFGMHWGGDGA